MNFFTVQWYITSGLVIDFVTFCKEKSWFNTNTAMQETAYSVPIDALWAVFVKRMEQWIDSPAKNTVPLRSFAVTSIMANQSRGSGSTTTTPLQNLKGKSYTYSNALSKIHIGRSIYWILHTLHCTIKQQQIPFAFYLNKVCRVLFLVW